MKKEIATGTLIGAALLCAPAQAQDPTLELLYTSEPGVSLPTSQWKVNGVYNDANGDGQTDLVMTRENDQGDITGLLAVDGATREEILRMEVETEDEFAGLEFFGFPDLFGADAGELRPALFAGPGEILYVVVSDGNQTIQRFRPGDYLKQAFLLSMADYNGDGRDDLAIYRSDTEQIEVWGVK